MTVARQLGATHVIDFTQGNVVEQIMAITLGRGVDVAIEALGTQSTFESALRVLRPGRTLSSLGAYASDLPGAFFAFTLQPHQHAYTQGSGEMSHVPSTTKVGDGAFNLNVALVVTAAVTGITFCHQPSSLCSDIKVN